MGEIEKQRRADIQWEEDTHRMQAPRKAYFCGCDLTAVWNAPIERSARAMLGTRAPQQKYEEFLNIKAGRAEQKTQGARQDKEEPEANERAKRERANEKARERRAKKTEERKRSAKEESEKAFAEAVAKEAAKQAAKLLKEEQIRMAKVHAAKKHERYRQSLIDSGRVPFEGEVMDMGWVETFSLAKCLFYDKDIEHFSFRCPEGGAVACPPYHYGLNRYTTSTH